MKHLFFCAVALLFITSCNEDKKQVKALQTETENMHDAAMKDMLEMNHLAKEIKEFMIKAIMTPEQSANYMNTLTAMGNAENDMMDWMAGYKAPDDKPAAEALKYLQEKKSLIEKNHAAIKAATEAGKKLLPQ